MTSELENQVASLRKELEDERSRREKLDALLLTNSNLRRKLLEELSEAKAKLDSQEGELSIAQADLGKYRAEAQHFKQLYIKSLEDLSAAKAACERQCAAVSQAEDAMMAMKHRLSYQDARLEQFSPSCKGVRVRPPELIAELQEDFQNVNGSQNEGERSDAVDESHQVNRPLGESEVPVCIPQCREWMDGAPVDDTLLKKVSSEGDLHISRIEPEEVQRVIIGLYRRLKACEVVLDETAKSRNEFKAKSSLLQVEVEGLRRKLVSKSPLAARKEALAEAQQRGRSSSATRTTSNVPSRAVSPIDLRRPLSAAAAQKPSSTAAAARSAVHPIGTALRVPSAVPSVAPSVRSTSARSHLSDSAVIPAVPTSLGVSGGTLRKNSFQLKEEFRIVSRSRSPVDRRAAVSPVSAAPAVVRPNKVETVHHEEQQKVKGVPPPPKAFVTFKAVLKGQMVDTPPVISRR